MQDLPKPRGSSPEPPPSDLAQDTAQREEGLLRAPGVAFLEWLVRHLCRELGCGFALVWERTGEQWDRSRLVAGSMSGGAFEPAALELPIAGSPCAGLHEGGAIVIESGVRARFPECEPLQALPVESCVAIALQDGAGRPLGHVSLLDEAPCSEPDHWLATLRRFAPRVAGELAARRAVVEMEQLLAAADFSRGRDVVEQHALCLARALRMPAVFVCEPVRRAGGRMRFRSLAWVRDGAIAPGFEVDAEGTPCADVYSAGRHFVAAGVAGRYPDDAMLAELGAEGYFGLLLQARDGRVLGHLGVLDRVPLRRELAELPIVRLHADAVRAELERRRADEQRLAAERRLADAQRRESLALLASGMAHDLNNQLMGILGHATLARGCDGRPAAIDPQLDAIEAAARGAADVVQRLLEFGGARGDDSPQDVGELARAALDAAGAARREGIAIETSFQDGLPAVLGDASQIQHALEALLANALEGLSGGRGRLRIGVARVDVDAALRRTHPALAALPAEPCVMVEVADDGEGMDAATLARAFEPFFTTRSGHRGLGLAVAHGIARAHRGALVATSVTGEGATLRLFLPVAADAGERVALDAGSLGGLALVVDDEPLVRTAMQRMLERLGFAVRAAADGVEALAALEELGGEVRVVLLDLTMPHLSGEEVFRSMRARRPRLPIVMMSGFSASAALDRLRAEGLAGFLQKPFGLAELDRCLRQSLRPTSRARAG